MPDAAIPPRPAAWVPLAMFVGVYAAVFGASGTVTVALAGAAMVLAHEPFSAERLQQACMGTLPLLAGMTVTVALELGAALLLARLSGAGRAGLGWARPAMPRWAWAAGALGLLFTGEVLDLLANSLDLGRFSNSLPMLAEVASSGRAGLIGMLVVGSLGAGLGEELFFRGYLQTRLRRSWSPGAAVAVTSLCFGIIHLDPIQSPMAMGLGLWLGWLRERSGSVWPGVAAHAFNNTVAFVLSVAVADGFSPAVSAVLLPVSLAISVGCGWALGRALPAPLAEGPA